MMPGSSFPCDEDLLRRLPLPLAQLYRRAHNAKSALERHQAAYYLWEAGLKLLASTAVAEYAEFNPKDAALSERLKNLARPSLGHWWEFVRRLLPLLADATHPHSCPPEGGGDDGFRAARDLVLGRTRDDLPRAAGLDAALRETLEGQAPQGGQTAVRLTELFDRLVKYRNRELGHGAAGQRPSEFYDRMGRALLLGTSEILGKVDVLAGRRLLFVDEVRREESGTWHVGRSELLGESARRLETLERPRSEASGLPDPGKAYLLAPGGRLLTLHPLLAYDPEAGEAFFLSARHGERRAEFLSYTSGRVIEREGAGGDAALLLERLLGSPVGRDAVEEWELKSRAEEPGASGEPAGLSERRIGGFDLLSRIGRGGMGVVYRAWQQSLGRQVALKCLLRSGDPKAEARFAREIRSLGRVEHPNLVKIFTSGSEGDQWFYAMELIEGADLASVCERLSGSTASEVSEAEWNRALTTACEEARKREEPLSAKSDGDAGSASGAPVEPPAHPPPHPSTRRAALLAGEGHIVQAVEMVRQAAAAAHALHEAGVVHRDIKPGNIMVTRDGSHAVLMDLGLAQLTDDTHGRLTRTRQFVGTLRYSSPEQVLAAAALDRRSDVYSLGATLWELLALRPLFGASEETPTPDLMLKIQTEDPESPRRTNPRVPQDLEAIVLKCLEKERARRYATAGDLAEDLERWQRGEAVAAQPPSLRYLLGKYVRRHQGRFAAAAALLLLALVTNFGAFWRVNEARKDATRLQKATETALFDTYTSYGVSAGDDGNPAQAVLWFANAARLAKDDARRQETNRIRIRNWSRLVPKPLRAFPHDGALKEISFDRTGGYLLTLSLNDRATVWDVEEEKKIELSALEKPVRLAAWSPKGDLLALATPEGRLELLKFPSGETLWNAEGGVPVRDLAFSPNGDHLTWGSEALHVLDLKEREFTQRSWPHPKPLLSLTFSAKGDKIATNSEDGLTRVFSLERPGGVEPAIPPLGGISWESNAANTQIFIVRPAFIDGDRGLLTLLDPSTVAWWDTATGERVRSISHLDQIGSVILSPSGRHFAVRGGLSDLELWDATTKAPVGLLLRADRRIEYARFAPDGALLATAEGDHSVRIWRLTQDPLHLFWISQPVWANLAARISQPLGVGPMAFSSDARFLAVAQADGLIRLYALPEERSWDHALPLSIAHRELAMSPDGRNVLATGGFSDNPLRGVCVFEVVTGRPAGPTLETRGIVLGGALASDGVHALTLASSAPSAAERRAQGFRPQDTPGRIRFWDFREGQLLFESPPTGGEPWAAVFQPAGKLAAVLCANGDLWLIDTDARAVAARLKHGRLPEGILQPGPCGTQFTPDGNTFITWGLGSWVKVWDTATRKERFPRIEHPAEELRDCKLSPDGRLLAASTHRNQVFIWDLATGRPAAPLLTQPGRTWTVEFSPRGDRLVTSCEDGLVRVWDWQKGILASPPLQHYGEVASAGYLPGGRWLHSETLIGRVGGGFLRVWEAESGTPVTPPIPAAGYQVFCEPGGVWGVQTPEKCAGVFRWADFTQLEPRSFDLEDELVWAEVISGQALHEGKSATNLTTAEWLERWPRIRESHRASTHLGRSNDEERIWHLERARKLREDFQWDAAAWHLRKVRELGGTVAPGEAARLGEFVRSWHFAPQTEPWPDPAHFVDMDPAKLQAVERAALAKPRLRSEGPCVNFAREFPRNPAYSAAWAIRKVVCDRPRELRIFAGSDDALRVWVNGSVVLEDLTLHPAFPDLVSKTAHLNPGENTLTAEVSNASEDWLLYLRLEDPSGKKLRLKDDDTLEPLEGLED